MPERIVSTTVYATVLAVLMGLLALTVYAAQFPLGEWSAVVALSIAAAKTLLIALFFMHWDRAGSLIRVFSLAGLLWLLLLMTLVLADYMRPERTGPEAQSEPPKPGLPILDAAFVCLFSTPTGFRLIAQGCEAWRATLGKDATRTFTPTGLRRSAGRGVEWHNPVGVDPSRPSLTQGSPPSRATLGYRAHRLWRRNPPNREMRNFKTSALGSRASFEKLRVGLLGSGKSIGRGTSLDRGPPRRRTVAIG